MLRRCNALKPGTILFLLSEPPQGVDGRARPGHGRFFMAGKLRNRFSSGPDHLGKRSVRPPDTHTFGSGQTAVRRHRFEFQYALLVSQQSGFVNTKIMLIWESTAPSPLSGPPCASDAGGEGASVGEHGFDETGF